MARPLKIDSKPKIVTCRKCGKSFKSYYRTGAVCPKCVRTLPKCFACGQIMALEYGYVEYHGKTINNHELCGSCWIKLREEKSLLIDCRDDGRCRVMLPDGKVVVRYSGNEAAGAIVKTKGGENEVF